MVKPEPESKAQANEMVLNGKISTRVNQKQEVFDPEITITVETPAGTVKVTLTVARGLLWEAPVTAFTFIYEHLVYAVEHGLLDWPPMWLVSMEAERQVKIIHNSMSGTVTVIENSDRAEQGTERSEK